MTLLLLVSFFAGALMAYANDFSDLGFKLLASVITIPLLLLSLAFGALSMMSLQKRFKSIVFLPLIDANQDTNVDDIRDDIIRSTFFVQTLNEEYSPDYSKMSCSDHKLAGNNFSSMSKFLKRNAALNKEKSRVEPSTKRIKLITLKNNPSYSDYNKTDDDYLSTTKASQDFEERYKDSSFKRVSMVMLKKFHDDAMPESNVEPSTKRIKLVSLKNNPSYIDYNETDDNHLSAAKASLDFEERYKDSSFRHESEVMPENIHDDVEVHLSKCNKITVRKEYLI